MMTTFTSPDWQTYALMDSGHGRKLERFGPYTIIRPEPRATWQPASSAASWQVDAEFVPAAQGGGGIWRTKLGLPERWQIEYKGLQMWIALEQSRQVGVFPENAVHWDWIEAQVEAGQQDMKVLNLFGYTGLASLAAARAGAQVTHIDSSRRALRIGKENQAISGLENHTIRWIAEDAVKFAEREVRRGNRYEGLIFDPPKYGLGPKRERWEFFSQFEHLCKVLRKCLSDQPQFVVVTAYALESEPEVLLPGLEILLNGLGGELTLGELVVHDQSGGREIDLSITGRWER